MRAFSNLSCVPAALPIDNIDTDRIIPARFLTTTTTAGLGNALFADWEPGRDATRTAELLVVGHNFGCGSSREHAVWALLDAGVRVVVSTGFADIFHANALRNGLVPITLEKRVHQQLLQTLDEHPSVRINVSLEEQTMSCRAFSATFACDAFAKSCITRGLDELGFLLEQLPIIETYESTNSQQIDTRGITP